jgi:hypothetical protein
MTEVLTQPVREERVIRRARIFSPAQSSADAGGGHTGAIILTTVVVLGVLWFLPELVRYLKTEMM